MNTRFLAVAGAAAALALPAGALADHGGGGRPENAGPQGSTGPQGETGPTGPDGPSVHGQQHGQGRSHKCSKVHTEGFQLHGNFVSFDGTTLTLSSAKGNKQARTLITNGSASLALGSATVSFSGLTDTNSDGTVGWDDVTTADKVIVHGRATVTKHGCQPSGAPTPPSIQRVKVVAPDTSSTSSDSAPTHS